MGARLLNLDGGRFGIIPIEINKDVSFGYSMG